MLLYNDAWAPIPAERHPWALGRPAREVWADIWEVIEPQLAAVMATGEGFVTFNQMLPMERGGVPHETYWNYSFSPIVDESGAVVGILNQGNETTDAVLAERAVRDSEERLQRALGSSKVGTWDWDVSADRVRADRRFAELYGVDPDRAADGAPIADYVGRFHPDDVDRVSSAINSTIAEASEFAEEYRLVGADGEITWVLATGRCQRDATTGTLRFPGIVLDISERRREEDRRRALIELDERLRDLDDPVDIAETSAEILGRTLGVSRAGYGTIDPEAETITIERDWNAPGVKSIAGTLHFRDYGTYIDDLKRGETVACENADTDSRTRATADALKAISAHSFINMPVTEQGEFVALVFVNHAEARQWRDADIAFMRDLAERTRSASERRRAEGDLRALAASLEAQVAERSAELLRAEEQLRQAQKMEAVGQLTGGIAHDFNNMLAVVIGGLNLLKRRLARGETDLDRYIDGAMEGAERAASLTQRLLAFSRQQPLDPKPVDANRLVADMTELLVRTLGEQARVETVLAAGLWRAHADPSQTESAILNLCVNARDAMPDGGRLTIETCNVHVDDSYARDAAIEPGQYVQIAVTDTGEGMTADVIEKAFDPFFTTKGIGKGTGLGLSQVFGFVRQSGGHVKIYSEPGSGTTVKLYLPRFYGPDEDVAVRAAEAATADGHSDEVILVVEDEARVRAYSVEALRELGYTVISAASGPEALALIEGGQQVTLLFTDVMMPDMTGRQLADRALKALPGLKILFTTGYTRNAVVHNGVLDPGTNFLPKPFGIEQLAAKVRAALDS
ncbi:ATP-binding protein [Allosphingosinicella indica]|uniref:ATP-binding protein n=1 Tax=Allosphingosinicella indica TaxID=941907 RepID=UPI0031397931